MSLPGCSVYLVEGEADKIKAFGRFNGGRPSPTLRALGYRNAIDFACDELAVVERVTIASMITLWLSAGGLRFNANLAA